MGRRGRCSRPTTRPRSPPRLPVCSAAATCGTIGGARRGCSSKPIVTGRQTFYVSNRFTSGCSRTARRRSRHRRFRGAGRDGRQRRNERSEEHTSELQSLMRISYAVFCLKKKKQKTTTNKIPKHKLVFHIHTYNKNSTATRLQIKRNENIYEHNVY